MKNNIIINRRLFNTILGASPFIGNQFLYSQNKDSDNSVIWIWLGGGPSQFETFNSVSSKEKYTSVVGTIRNPGSPIQMASLWKNTIQHTDKFSVVANFSHSDASHLQATHWMNTGHYNPERATTAIAKYPSYGSIVSYINGSSNKFGIPSYVTQDKIEGDTSSWLGSSYDGFNPNSKDNLTPRVQIDRFSNRRDLLNQLDIQDENFYNQFRNQAFDVIMGKAKDAFNDEAWISSKDKYGDSNIGKQLWYSKRLTEYGVKFVTLHYGGWDMHSNIKNGVEKLVPPIDRALSALFSEINTNTMVIVTGEFGRTSLNVGVGRDHWPLITPLLIGGGSSYTHNRVIGKVDSYNYKPESKPYTPIDLQHTLFDFFGIDKGVQKIDNSGRPRYLLDGESRNILI